MHLDAIDLKEFYASPLGGVVRRLLGSRLRARWSDLIGMSLFGLGFATPYLGAFRSDASPLGALMPAELGAMPWPNGGDGMSVLVDETDSPFPMNAPIASFSCTCSNGASALGNCCGRSGACWRRTAGCS